MVLAMELIIAPPMEFTKGLDNSMIELDVRVLLVLVLEE